MKPITDYKHVIWDWNGTLLNDLDLCVDIMDGILQARGLPGLSVERYRNVFHFPVIDYYRKLGFDFDAEPFEIVGTEFIRTYESRRLESRLHSDVESVLGALQSAGVGQSILSAYQQETLDELVTHFDLMNYFEKVVGLDNHYAAGKVETGRRWMQELPHEPHSILLVGDSAHDYDVAEAIGTDCVLVSHGHYTRERLEACPVPVVDCLSDLLRDISPVDSGSATTA